MVLKYLLSFFSKSSDSSSTYTEKPHHYFRDYLHFLEHGRSEETSMSTILMYNLKFLILIGISFIVAYVTSAFFYDSLETSHAIATEIFMVPLFFIASALMIPYIRSKERIQGVRMSMLASGFAVLLLVIFFIISGSPDLILKLFIPIASYILLAFMFCPEVIGMSGNVVDWFKKGRQVRIMLLYVAVVCLYVFGFGSLFYSIESGTGDHFTVRDNNEVITHSDMYYHSIVTFSSLGYGDISPKSPAARLAVSAEVLISMMINILFIAILFVYISNSQIFAAKRNEQLLERKKHQLDEEKEEIETLQKSKGRKTNSRKVSNGSPSKKASRGNRSSKKSSRKRGSGSAK